MKDVQDVYFLGKVKKQGHPVRVREKWYIVGMLESREGLT